MSDARPWLQKVAPLFAGELADTLHKEGYPEIAEQIFTLEIWERCGCSDDFCASFYTGPKPDGAWADIGDHRNLVPMVSEGMVVLDVVAGIIRYVEVIDRPDVKPLIDALPTA